MPSPAKTESEESSSDDDDWVLAVNEDRVNAALSNKDMLHPIVVNQQIVPVLIDSGCGPNVLSQAAYDTLAQSTELEPHPNNNFHIKAVRIFES